MRPWAEIRRTRAEGLRLPALCLAVAVAAMTATRGFEQQSAQALSREARGLAGADLEITSPRPLPEAELQCAKSALGAGWRHASLRDFLSMAAIPGTPRSRLVEVRAWGDGYPFYGKFVTTPAQSTSKAVPLPPLLTQDDLLSQLDWKPGEPFQLGKQKFQLQGRVSDETTTAGSAFALGPRVWISLSNLPATGLAGPESRVRYREVFATAPGTSATDPDLAEKREVLQKCLKDPASQARTYREASPQLRGFFTRLSEFLGLLSLLVALMGGTGIAFAMRAQLQTQEKKLAILSCLGASRLRIGRYLGLQSLFVGITGATLGAVFGFALGKVLPRLAQSFFPFQLDLASFPALAAFEAWAWGILLCLVFGHLGTSTLPWGNPLSLLRGEGAAEETSSQPAHSITTKTPIGHARFGSWALTAVALLLLGYRQTRSWTGPASVVGLIALGGVLYFLLLLSLSAFERASSRVDAFFSLPVRLGLRHLWRRKRSSALAACFLTLATLQVGSMLQLRNSMLTELEAPAGKSRPQFFLIDLAEEDRNSVESLTSRLLPQGPAPQFSKLVSARLRSVNDSAPQTAQDAENRSREFRLTERAALYPSEKVLKGTFWGTPGHRPEQSIENEVEASIEVQWGERSGVHLGDRLSFEIQGVPLTARVTSVRSVQWARFEPNFFVVLQPGALEGAPYSWIASVAGLESDSTRREFQTEMAKNLPTASLIDVRDASQKLSRVILKIEALVRFISIFSALTGILGVALIAWESARSRAREMALLGILGAKKSLIFRALGVEFGTLGAVAAALGTSLASGVAGAILARQFGLPAPVFDRHLALLGILTAVGVVSASLLASRRSLKESPLQLFKNS